jgi:hypothetical protein
MNLFAEFFDLGFVKNIALVFLDGDVIVEKDNAAQSEFTREEVQPFWDVRGAKPQHKHFADFVCHR